jgi:MFS family permease
MGLFSTFRMSSLALGPLLGGYIYDSHGIDATFLTGAGLIVAGMIAVQFWVREVRSPVGTDRYRCSGIFKCGLLSGPMLSLGLAMLVMASSEAMIAPLEQTFNARLGQSATAFGFAFSALLFARIAVLIPVGHLSDRIGRKRLIVAGLLLVAATLVPMGLVARTWQLVALRALQGVGTAAIAAPTYALVGDLSSSGAEGSHMSIIMMGFGIGLAVGTMTAGILAVISLALPFWTFAGVALAVAWAVHHTVPETVVRESSRG